MTFMESLKDFIFGDWIELVFEGNIWRLIFERNICGLDQTSLPCFGQSVPMALAPSQKPVETKNHILVSRLIAVKGPVQQSDKSILF